MDSCLRALGSPQAASNLQEPAGDPAIVAQAIARILPGMIQDAEEAGLTIVADHLTRTLNAAEVGSAEQESPLGRIE